MTATARVLDGLGVTLPVLAAPMAGGPSTVRLVEAAGRAGSLGFLAGGYKSAEQLAGQIRDVRATTPAFGVNLFVPNPADISTADYTAYAEAVRPVAERYGVELPRLPLADDDEWPAKLSLLQAEPVPLVSFTFGIPSSEAVRGLRRAGTVVAQSVTSVAEARAAAEAGVDVLAVQAATAGGHSATLTPAVVPAAVPLPELVAAIARDTSLPIVAAGGIADPAAAAASLAAGAAAVMVGTALLRTPESGASAVHRSAVGDPNGPDTVVTRAFTGRPARAIRNAFTDRFDATAPVGYPAVHHLTSALRKAAAAAGDPQAVHLWAGVGYRRSVERPAADVLTALAG